MAQTTFTKNSFVTVKEKKAIVGKRPIVVPLPVHIHEVELAVLVIAIDIQETTVAVLVSENRGSIVYSAIYDTAVRLNKQLNFT